MLTKCGICILMILTVMRSLVLLSINTLWQETTVIGVQLLLAELDKY